MRNLVKRIIFFFAHTDLLIDLRLGGTYAEICSANFYEKGQSFKLIAFSIFVQFIKDQQGGFCPPSLKIVSNL